jgi:hypothetical protein
MAMTLHAFTLKLLSDPTALSQFAANPEGVLQAAGLGDITAGDVHDVLPLVMDHAPLPVVEAFEQSVAAGGLPGLSSLPGADAVSTLQELTQHLTSVAPALPVDGLSSLPLGGDELGRALPVDGLAGGLPVGDLSGGLPVDGVIPSLPLPDESGLVPGLPVDSLPAAPQLPNLPLDGVTGAVPAVPGVPVAALTDPNQLVADVRGSLADPGRAVYSVQSMTEQIVQGAPAVVAHGGLPVGGSLPGLGGLGSTTDVTKTLDSTVHSATGVAGNVPVAGKVVADTTSHVTTTVHSVDVDTVGKTVAGITGNVGALAHDPIHAVTNIGDVSHTLDTVTSVANTVHGDQVLQHVTGVADTAEKDLNIGADNHIGGIGNVDLGGVHVNDVANTLDGGHHVLPGF